MAPKGLLLLAAFAAIPAPALAAPDSPLTAEQALEKYREAFPTTREIDCPRAEEGEEQVVVCGRRGPDPNRLTAYGPPLEPEPGARVAGEPLSDMGGCIQRCHAGVSVNVFAVARTAVKIVRHILDPD
jgi:hypothetical protein